MTIRQDIGQTGSRGDSRDRGSGLANHAIADRLDEVGRLLAEQGANPFRIRAYHRAAERMRLLEREVFDLHASGGLAALEALPEIGESLARAIRDLALRGKLGLLERLRGETDPLRLLQTVPGVGPVLAETLHHRLGIDSLEDLEVAARNGTLAAFANVGPRRLAAITASLSERLANVRRGGTPPAGDLPPVEELLDVDREYRERVAAGTLPRITPRRMNPHHEAWLPIQHTTRGARHYTALNSNTPRAHEQRATHDWVVLYFDQDGGGGERQCTVITSRFGVLAGHRVVRGREDECRALARRREWDAAVEASRTDRSRKENVLQARLELRPAAPGPLAGRGTAG